ncbi:7974_t:CDS:2, partial [Gigaspora margarita]
TSDNELLTDSNSVLNSESSKDNHTIIQLSSGFLEALRLLEIKAHSNMMNKMYYKIMNTFNEQNYQELVEEEHFIDYQDIVLTASLNGYNIFKQKLMTVG